MNESQVKDVIFEAIETSLEAQLRAVRRLRSGKETAPKSKIQKGLSRGRHGFRHTFKNRGAAAYQRDHPSDGRSP